MTSLASVGAVVVTALVALNHQLLLIAAAVDGWGQ